MLAYITTRKAIKSEVKSQPAFCAQCLKVEIILNYKPLLNSFEISQLLLNWISLVIAYNFSYSNIDI